MNVNELRIGSWVTPKLSGDTIAPRQVKRISENGVVIEFGITLRNADLEPGIIEAGEPRREYSFDEIEGVPLTPTILKQLRFSDLTTIGIYERDGLFIQQKEGGFYLVDRELIVASPNITYVHQLQDLYLVLKGEELQLRF
jgi:hypothetical protein